MTEEYYKITVTYPNATTEPTEEGMIVWQMWGVANALEPLL